MIRRTGAWLALVFLCVCAKNLRAENSPTWVTIGKTGSISLEKLPWEFYWRRFLTTGDFRRAQKPDLILQPASIWNGKIVRGEELSSFGYATYRLQLRGNLAGQRLAIRLPAPFTSYRLFVNGEMLSEGGRPGRSAEECVARRKPSLMYFTAAADDLQIIIHVANFLTYKGGLRGSIDLGRADAMHVYGMRYLAIDLFSTGLIFSIMLYHLVVFALTRRHISTLIFALLAFVYFLLAFLFGEQAISLIFPELPVAAHVRAGAFFVYLLPPLVLEFTARLYPGTIARWIVWLYWIVAALFVSLLFFPPVYFTKYNIVYYALVALPSGLICIGGTIRAAKRKLPGGYMLLLGLFFLVALTIYAVFLFATHSVAGGFLSIGFTLFALFQSGSLAQSHAALDRENTAMQARLERSRAALENQRKQIEANLHDSLGGNLTDIKLGLEALEKNARAHGLAKDIRRLDHRVVGTIASLRTELLFLEDMQLAMKDFVSGINLILLRRYQMAKKPVDIHVDPETRERSKQLESSGFLSDEIRPELCLMVQELCNNSLKYTSGTAHWKIHATARSLTISVRGKSRHNVKKTGSGKETLRSRAQKIHARFDESLEKGIYQASVSLP